MEDQPLAIQLEAFGLSPTEAAMYLHLVSKQPKTIVELARDLDLPRTSVYDNAVKLAEKGLVQKVVTHKSQKLKAYSLSILQASLDSQKMQIDELQQKLASLEDILEHALAVPAATEVRYYYGAKGFQQMMWNSLKAKNGLVGYSQFGRAQVVGLHFTEKYIAEAIKRNIVDRVIANPSPESLKLITSGPGMLPKESQSIRMIAANKLYVSGDSMIYNDTFAVLYWTQGEVVGVEIENAELVKTQLGLFEIAWATAEPLEKYL